MTIAVLDGGGASRNLGSLLVAGEHAVMRAMVGSSDGLTGVIVLTDSSGRIVSVGAGVAGTPAGGVLSVQGVASGTALPISAASLPLPSGAATAAAQAIEITALGTLLTTTAFQARLPVSGQALMAASVPVTLASNQSTIAVSVAPPSTPYNGQNTIASAGTREALASSQVLGQGVWVKALTTNGGLMFVGGSTVSAGNGYPLAAGESVFVPTANLASVYIDAATTGNGVAYLGF